MLDPKRLSVVFAVAMLPALLAQGPSSDVLVIEGGTLVDGRGGAPVRDALIVVEGNIIKTVTRKGQAAYPSRARVIRAGRGEGRRDALYCRGRHHDQSP